MADIRNQLQLDRKAHEHLSAGRTHIMSLHVRIRRIIRHFKLYSGE